MSDASVKAAKCGQFEVKQRLRGLQRQRAALGRFKGVARSPEDRAERTRLDVAIRAAVDALRAGAVVLGGGR